MIPVPASTKVWLAAALIETAKLNGINPQAWLTETLARI